MIAFTSTTSDQELYTLTNDDGVWATDLPEDTYIIHLMIIGWKRSDW